MILFLMKIYVAIRDKLIVIFSKVRYFIMSYPRRLLRFLSHPFSRYFRLQRLHFWLLEWLFLAMDLLGLPEILEILYEIFHWDIRPLHIKEVKEIEQVFGNTVNYNLVRINPNEKWVCKRMNIAFVSFHTIHFHNGISLPTLVHEIIHIWQYERYGSPYIIRSLLAQRSKEGYNYGGVLGLIKAAENGDKIEDFNYEQMGDIVKDAYIIQNRVEVPQKVKESYAHFTDLLRNK